MGDARKENYSLKLSYSYLSAGQRKKRTRDIHQNNQQCHCYPKEKVNNTIGSNKNAFN
jgi:hypothetical protein